MRTSLAVAALLCSSASAQENVKFPVSQVVDIVEGFLLGAFDAEGMTNIDQCVSDADAVVRDATAAIMDFEQKDISHIEQGLGKVADMLKTIAAGMKDCGQLPDDIKKIESMVTAFSSPQAFAWHIGKDLLVNGVDIYHDIDNGIKDYNSQSWKSFGQDIGNASAKILLGSAQLELELNDDEDTCNALNESGCHANKACSWCKAAAVPSACHSVENGKKLPPGPFTCDNLSEEEPVKVDVQMMVQIVEGFLKGAVEAEGLTDIEKCIQDAEGVIQDAETAVTDFEKKDLQDIVAGFKAVADLVNKVKQGMQDCGHLQNDIKKLETIVATYTNLPAFAWHVGKSLLVNGVEIYHDINSAITNYRASNWEQFGENVGDASAKVFLGATELEKVFPEDKNLFLY